MNPKKDGFVILSVATRREITENAPVWMEHKRSKDSGGTFEISSKLPEFPRPPEFRIIFCENSRTHFCPFF